MDTLDASPVPSPAPQTPRVRPQSFRLCSATKRDGSPCKGAAGPGKNLCNRHDERAQRTKAEAQADGITLTPLSKLVLLDVSTAPGLKRFRQGVMAHVARSTLDPTQAKSLLDTALSIYESDHKVDGKAAFEGLATRIASRLARAKAAELPHSSSSSALTQGEGGKTGIG